MRSLFFIFLIFMSLPAISGDMTPLDVEEAVKSALRNIYPWDYVPVKSSDVEPSRFFGDEFSSAVSLSVINAMCGISFSCSAQGSMGIHSYVVCMKCGDVWCPCCQSHNCSSDGCNMTCQLQWCEHCQVAWCPKHQSHNCNTSVCGPDCVYSYCPFCGATFCAKHCPHSCEAPFYLSNKERNINPSSRYFEGVTSDTPFNLTYNAPVYISGSQASSSHSSSVPVVDSIKSNLIPDRSRLEGTGSSVLDINLSSLLSNTPLSSLNMSVVTSSVNIDYIRIPFKALCYIVLSFMFSRYIFLALRQW